VGAPPRVQNLFVIASGVEVRRSEVLKYEFKRGFDAPDESAFRVRVVFGKKRGNISWTVKAPLGLDLYGLLMVRQYVEVECENRGYVDLVWAVRNYEFLWDHLGVRLEGVKALTLDDLEGTMEKYYQRDEVLRREVRSSQEARFEDLIALTTGGVPTFQIIQGVDLLSKKIDSLTDAFKGSVRVEQETQKQNRAILDALYRFIDKVDKNILSRA